MLLILINLVKLLFVSYFEKNNYILLLFIYNKKLSHTRSKIIIKVVNKISFIQILGINVKKEI
jgi:hypothetical protein